VFQTSGIARTDESETLRTRVSQLEQQVLDLHQELEERTDDLDASWAANRDLMTLANRAQAKTHPEDSSAQCSCQRRPAVTVTAMSAVVSVDVVRCSV
jgi:hypothetical protein